MEIIDERSILVIGSNIRFLTENAVRHGHNIISVDYYGDWDHQKLTRNISIKRDGDGLFALRALMDMAAGLDCKAVVYGPGFEHDVFAITRLKTFGEVYGCRREAVRKSRDPEFLIRAGQSWNFKYPPIRYRFDGSIERSKWLRKPFASVGGGEVARMGANVDEKEGFFYQEYVPGLPSSALVVSNGSDATLLGASTQIVGDNYFGATGFRFVGNIFPHPFYRDIAKQLSAIAEALTLELTLKGIWGFDFIYNGEVTLIEVNPRPTASLGVMGDATWNDFLSLHIAGSTDENSSLIIDPGPTDKYFAQGRIFAKEDVVFTSPEKWSELGAKDIPHEGEFIAKGDPVLTLAVEETSYNNAMIRLHEAAQIAYADLAPATATSM